MNLGSMMDSVFYLGLIVTFLLIILLAYHFKQRVSVLEEKNHTMFEILNNVVKELNVIRMNQMQYANTEETMIEDNMGGNSNVDNIMYETREIAESDEEYDSESDEGSESGSDDGSESESGSETEDESSNVKLIQVKEEELSVNDIPEVDNFETTEYNNLPEADEDNVQELKEESVLKVEKVDTPLEESISQEPEDVTEDKDYSSYTLAQLKAMVISQGISTNPSKLKKSEVIALLEENDKQQ